MECRMNGCHKQATKVIATEVMEFVSLCDKCSAIYTKYTNTNKLSIRVLVEYDTNLRLPKGDYYHEKTD